MIFEAIWGFSSFSGSVEEMTWKLESMAAASAANSAVFLNVWSSEPESSYGSGASVPACFDFGTKLTLL